MGSQRVGHQLATKTTTYPFTQFCLACFIRMLYFLGKAFLSQQPFQHPELYPRVEEGLTQLPECLPPTAFPAHPAADTPAATHGNAIELEK